MSSENSVEGLKRVVDVRGLAINIVNCVVGAGIFVLPAIISLELGAFSIYGYVFCGIMMAAIMFCYAETGSRVTGSGGSYAYVEAAFGSFAGYLVNWLYFFGWGILGSASLMNVIADSLAVILPVFANQWCRAALFFLITALIILVNVRGAKQGISFVKFITLIKLLPLFGIIIFGFNLIKGSNLHWEHLPSVKTFGAAMLILFYAFASFETALGGSGEIINPKRTIPLGILFGGMLVLIIYIFLQIVVQGVLGNDMAIFKDAPLAAVAQKIIGPAGATILLITAAISCFGNITSDVLTTPRLLFAAARDGIFPKFLSRVHPKFATPHLAIFTYGSLIFIFSISGGFKQLAALASAAILLVYLAVVLSTIKLRRTKQAEAEKIFIMPGGLIIPVIGIATIMWLLTGLTSNEISSCVIFIAIICVVYFVKEKFKRTK